MQRVQSQSMSLRVDLDGRECCGLRSPAAILPADDGLQSTDGLVGKCGWDRCPAAKAQKYHMDNADGSRIVQQAIHSNTPEVYRHVLPLNGKKAGVYFRLMD
jgi:hypothetical protein